LGIRQLQEYINISFGHLLQSDRPFTQMSSDYRVQREDLGHLTGMQHH